MSGSEPSWESFSAGPSQGPDGVRVWALNVPDPQSFEIVAHLGTGTGDYILGVRSSIKNRDKCFLMKITDFPGYSWYCEKLCEATGNHVRCTLHNRMLSFVHGSSEMDVLSKTSMVTKQLPDDDYVPFILTSWSDTRVECKFRGLPPTPGSLGVALYQAKKFTDATIKCHSQEMAVHRAVLALASPVFDRMFSSGMQEAQEATLEIEDAAPATVQNMIKYIYTQDLSDTSDLADLYEIANKYMMPRLARDVGEKMVETLDANNAREYCKIVRQHASLDNAEAKGLWELLYGKLQDDQTLMRVVFEALLIDSRASPAAKRPRLG